MERGCRVSSMVSGKRVWCGLVRLMDGWFCEEIGADWMKNEVLILEMTAQKEYQEPLVVGRGNCTATFLGSSR